MTLLLLKRGLLLALLFQILIMSHSPRQVESRPLPVQEQQRYSKMFALLGLICECCDGVGGDCRSTWVSSCSKLQCLPWRSH